jgi:hypothetical protein
MLLEVEERRGGQRGNRRVSVLALVVGDVVQLIVDVHEEAMALR